MATGQSYGNDMMQDDTDIMHGVSDVTEFFNNQNVLITGASGFLGKLIVEKLLRSCPKIGKLYMIMRPKKGKTTEERFKEHFEDTLYNKLREERPNFLKDVIMIEGDTGLSDLGLAPSDREKLIENVNVVFHGAATVRFDEPLRQVVNINIRGTKLILLLAKEMKNLKAFIHISTAFSNCTQENIEEKFYKPPMNSSKILALADMLDDELLEHMKSKLLGKWPNTYAFSKAISEDVIKVDGVDLPIAIIRPSIVIATHKEPVAGWINNYYGPTGVVMGAGIGLLRTLHCEASKIADIIPADYVVNNIIVCAWDTAKQWEEKQKNMKELDDGKKENPAIYNCVSRCQKPINWGTFMQLNEQHGREVPSALVLWHYFFMLNKHLWLHKVCCFLLHTIPGAIVDVLATLAGRDPILLKAYKKIHKFSGVISYFSTQEWKFDNKKFLELWDRTSSIDKEKFYFHLGSLDWNDYFYHHVRGLRLYILKDPLHTIPEGKIKFNRLRMAHYAICTVLSLLFAWALYSFLKFFISWCPYFD